MKNTTSSIPRMIYETRTIKTAVLTKGDRLFDISCTEIEIVDEAAGEFLEVKQCTEDSEGTIKIDPHEWPTLKAAIDKMIKECRNYDK